MKKNFIFILLLLSIFCCAILKGVIQESGKVTLQLDKQKQEKMKLLIGIINPSDTLNLLMEIVKKDLSCALQKLSGFNVTIQFFDKIPSKNALKKLSVDGFPIVIFIQEVAGGKALEWRCYDSLHASMQKGKRMYLKNAILEIDAHKLADIFWNILTGQEGIFSTRIAYCVETMNNNHKGSDIYIKNPYNEMAQCLVHGGKLLAPRWNKSNDFPLLLYSEVTPSNIRLMSTTLQQKRKIVSNFDGLTMLPSFSSNDQKVVYCASYKGSSQIYICFIDTQKMKMVCKRITHNAGNNTSPTLLENGDIVFCSDFEAHAPQLYYLHASDGKLERLTQSGYCACPHFSEKNNKIAYCKLVGNTMQIFTYDLSTKQHKQVTIF
jgi:hypothetical protein